MNKKLTNTELNNTKEMARPFRLQDIFNMKIVYDERMSSFEEIIQNARKGDYTEIMFASVKQFVFANGCPSSDECISIIKDLRDKGVNIHFLDYSINSNCIEDDMKLGSLIGDAVYELYLKQNQ